MSIDTKIRKNLTSKVIDLFAVKRLSSNEKKNMKKGFLIRFDGESFVVAGVREISNIDFLKDLAEIVDYLQDY